MLLRYEGRNPGVLYRLGLFALVVAGIGTYLVRHKTGWSESVTDPVTGLLYGVAIATMLLGLYLRKGATRLGDNS